jgi:4-amino-4-deoxy-L-arabinose transferase
MNFNPSGIFRDGRKEIILIALSLAIEVLVFLPWQIYIFQAFPVESTFEAQWNSRHITEALENHAGPWYYYILQMPLQFGKICALLIPLGLFSLFAFSRNRLLLVALLFCLIVPYAFFSIIVQTRMPSYVYMSHFIIWLSFGLLVLGLSELPPINKDFKFKAIIQTSFLFIFSLFFVFKIHDILSNDLLQQAVGNIQSYRENKIHNTEIYKKLDQLVPPGYVVFNCNSFENVEAMFYSNRTVYHWFPDQKQYDSLINLGIKIAAFESHEQYQLPEYMRRDTSIILIKDNLK